MTDDTVVNMNFTLGKDQTVADIVTLLRKYQPYSKLHGQAADEIERLRTAGDALVAAIRNHMLSEKDIRAWEEVRGD